MLIAQPTAPTVLQYCTYSPTVKHLQSYNTVLHLLSYSTAPTFPHYYTYCPTVLPLLHVLQYDMHLLFYSTPPTVLYTVHCTSVLLLSTALFPPPSVLFPITVLLQPTVLLPPTFLLSLSVLLPHTDLFPPAFLLQPSALLLSILSLTPFIYTAQLPSSTVLSVLLPPTVPQYSCLPVDILSLH